MMRKQEGTGAWRPQSRGRKSSQRSAGADSINEIKDPALVRDDGQPRLTSKINPSASR